jgi:hypothetical protein
MCQTLAKQSHPLYSLTVFTETFEISDLDKDGMLPNSEFLSRSGLLLPSAQCHVNLELYKMKLGVEAPTLVSAAVYEVNNAL